MNYTETNLKNKIITNVFMAWFVISLIGMIIPSITMYVFGQYFLVFGLITIHQRAYIGYVAYLVGYLAIIITGIVKNYANLRPIISDPSISLLYPVIVAGLILLLGLLFSLFYMRNSNKKIYYWFFIETTILSLVIFIVYCF